MDSVILQFALLNSGFRRNLLAIHKRAGTNSLFSFLGPIINPQFVRSKTEPNKYPKNLNRKYVNTKTITIALILSIIRKSIQQNANAYRFRHN